jgi:chromosome partitioning protein
VSHIGKNFDVLLSRKDMREAEQFLYKGLNGATILKKKLEGLKDYDYVLIDCPPSTGILTQNALYYADEVIIPTLMEPLSVDSAKKLMRFIADFSKQTGHSVKISRILPTLYDRRNKISNTILNELRNEFYQKVSDPIRINSKLREAPRSQRSIFMYAPSSQGAKDYKLLVNLVLQEEASKARLRSQAADSTTE